MMSDLISREDAITKFKKSCTSESIDKNGIKRGEIHTAMTYEGIIKIIESLPSAEKWIPVSEELPKEKGEYLVSYHPCHWNTVSEKVVVGMDTFRGKTTWAKKKYQKVIAWMPLPEPWRGE